MAILKNRFLKVLAIIASVIIVFVVAVMAFIKFAPQFGAKPSGEHLQKIAQSSHYEKDQFVNLIETKMDMSFSNSWGMLKESLSSKNTSPKEELDTFFGTEKPAANDSNIVVTWYGHSALLLEIEGKKIFLDPMLGPYASPVPIFGKRFKNAPTFDFDNIPQLDAVIYSHDHYDHLDYYTIKRIKDKVGHFYTPLGLGSHLKAWGVPEEKITELDWWDEARFGQFTFTATPARHFSGRGTDDRNKTLWASWVIQGEYNKIYFSGDGGYGPHFKEIGERMGPFDFAMMECGQYNERWEPIHMMPEQTVQASLDVKTKSMMPIHWGGFSLAPHEWFEPAERVAKAASEVNLELVTPKIGKAFSLSEDLPHGQWWEGYMPD
ncbi:MAG: hypothetical protein CMB80_20145 [Flammeovirgaceae bacterium]|nr:hypothetical protein [Flammeovirgaceae bacterium]MBE61048.1 hypothetical protein [Flammeovirgaceae bacterium]MBR08371.1 hypothetical protein [Rickettsiales bacterium]HCX21093.1 hypothetical protein [Cytophagales bacterium]|tara:strand:- start:3339 stop:4472 length:1134 start_codon:yes stop_codon:yes gene_type:complete